MKKNCIFFALICASLSACNNAGEKQQSQNVADAPVTAPAPATQVLDSATKANNWMEYMTPGDNHKMLAAAEGKWKTTMTMFMEGQDTMPPSIGVCEFKMIMGGRYRVMTMKSEMMSMPFEGMGCIGYDNAKKVFVETWVDNMGTGMMVMEGNYDAGARTIETKGKCMDGETRTERFYRSVAKTVDDKNMVMEMYVTDDKGGEKKAFEIRYTRI